MELDARVRAQKGEESAESDDGEGQVGGDVVEMGDTEERAAVGEVIVGLRLRRGGGECGDDRDDGYQGDQE